MPTEFSFDRLYIGGQWTTPIDGGVRGGIDPATGQSWAEVAYGGPGDIDLAVASAREVFEETRTTVISTTGVFADSFAN